MKYYVVTDVHGFFTQMKTALENAGFFSGTEPHRLIVCGDMMDRGSEALQMQEFMLDLLHKDELIFIRGNHEDLMVQMMQGLSHSGRYASIASHHYSNGTFDTAVQLTKMTPEEAVQNPQRFAALLWETPFMKELIPASVNYFETSDTIFVHGYIPCYNRNNRQYEYTKTWRASHNREWDDARWFNGMDAACNGKIVEPGKTIVCGHWHTSWGHSKVEGKCTEFGDDADFSPFYSDGIIALDGCTAHSDIVNCITFEFN